MVASCGGAPSLGPFGATRIRDSTECGTEPPPVGDTPGVEETPIFGRDRELASLRAGLVAAAGGAGRLVLGRGQGGISKSRLASAVALMAASYGILVARGHAVDDPGMPPLWPWRRRARSLPALGRLLSEVHLDDSARFAMLADAADVLVAEATAAGLLIVLEDLP